MGADELIKAMQEIIEESKVDEITRPFNSPMDNLPESVFTKISEDSQKLLALHSTRTFLDAFFLDKNDKPMGGIPVAAQIGLVGLPDSGKSLVAQELALKLADAGDKVVLVTAEDAFQTANDRYDLQSRMMDMAEKFFLNKVSLKENLFVLDTVSKSQLRDWQTFIIAYRNLVEKEGCKYLVFDSLTLIEDYRSAIKYRLLELVRYNQLHGVTALFISQRATEDADKFGMAGGIGLSHILDIVFALDYQKVWSGDAQMKLDMGVKQGEFVRFIRCLKCRLCGFDGRYHRIEITKDGLVKILPPKAEELPSEPSEIKERKK